MKKMLIGLAALIAAGLANTTTAEAAQGCGPGWGRDAFGFCRPFKPGPVYGPYGWYGPRYYRPVRYGWYGPRHYRPVRYGWYGPRYYKPYRPVISVGFYAPHPVFW
ncbi:GCG_CRPN prefix-to-repeats domain-containing protein [Enterovirga aerilata]|uniref:Sulfur globule protein n=1 Tax=Enterovirga aerilata TaxID=2730920 RepID=A0A849I5M8_9HYPH|nr:hypothetical protein [Enterovirga sp. DB1703]NNM71400.1 hypothetical protein [Enterovirga sp. DB1703]